MPTILHPPPPRGTADWRCRSAHLMLVLYWERKSAQISLYSAKLLLQGRPQHAVTRDDQHLGALQKGGLANVCHQKRVGVYLLCDAAPPE
jgi:hypothetical protein